MGRRFACLTLGCLALAGGCGGVAADGEPSDGLRAELSGVVEAARSELEGGREALARTFEGEASERLARLVVHVEEAALRLGEGHLAELQRVLDEGGLERALDSLEARGAEGWERLRGELEAGADRLAVLLERWQRELAATPEDVEARSAAAEDLPRVR